MASGPYTLLDLATRSGVGVHSLIEGVLTYAPELQVVPTFPRAGLSYTTLTNMFLPRGDFRKVGTGVGLMKSEWKREVGSMVPFEAQMRVPEDVVIAARSENPELVTGDILADEALRHMRGSMIRIGSQFWYGQSISGDGFAGLSTQVPTATNQITAGTADGTNSSSAYLVYLDDTPTNPQGVHFLLGNGGRMQFLPTWATQQVADPNDATKFLTAFTNNFLGFLGLVSPRTEAVYRCKGISVANPFNDLLAAQLIALIPQALMADKSKWRWFMNVQARYTLQASRSTVNIATAGSKGVGAGGVFPDVPQTCQDIAIVCTDSLRTTDRAGLYN